MSVLVNAWGVYWGVTWVGDRNDRIPADPTISTHRPCAPDTAPAAALSRLNDRTRPLIAAVDRLRPRVVAVHAHAHAGRGLLGHGRVPGPRPGARHRPSRPAIRPTRCCCGWRRSCSSRSATRPSALTCCPRCCVAAACGIVGATVACLTKRLVVGVGIGIAFAVASRVWAIGLHADPHAFHLFLIALLLLLLVVWADRHKAGRPDQDRAARSPLPRFSASPRQPWADPAARAGSGAVRASRLSAASCAACGSWRRASGRWC